MGMAPYGDLDKYDIHLNDNKFELKRKKTLGLGLKMSFSNKGGNFLVLIPKVFDSFRMIA